MNAKKQPQNQPAEKRMPATKPNDLGKLAISGHIKIFDPNSQEVLMRIRS